MNKEKYLYKLVMALLFLFCLQFTACTNHKVETVEPAFYFWKSNSNLSDQEKETCDTLHIQKLYIKFFEVNFNPERGNFPEAKTNWWEYQRQQGRFREIIPTVYLRNVVFLKSSKEELDILADNVHFLVTKFTREKFSEVTTFRELQMDCDWTLKSKDNYFYFLKKLKAITGKQISCTLRLYPYKYPDKMGVPPVDKVTLMCYNLLNPLENPGKNSILDLNELERYLQDVKKYPLHLDVALPVYSWAQVYHNERFAEVLYADNQALKTILKQGKPLWYTVSRDTVIHDTYLRSGDQVKYEEIDAEMIKGAIALLKKHVAFDQTTTITLFHLDDEQLNRFSHAELSSFYTEFSK